jgi:hypothetical protein
VTFACCSSCGWCLTHCTLTSAETATCVTFTPKCIRTVIPWRIYNHATEMCSIWDRPSRSQIYQVRRCRRGVTVLVLSISSKTATYRKGVRVSNSFCFSTTFFRNIFRPAKYFELQTSYSRDAQINSYRYSCKLDI